MTNLKKDTKTFVIFKWQKGSALNFFQTQFSYFLLFLVYLMQLYYNLEKNISNQMVAVAVLFASLKIKNTFSL